MISYFMRPDFMISKEVSHPTWQFFQQIIRQHVLAAGTAGQSEVFNGFSWIPRTSRGTSEEVSRGMSGEVSCETSGGEQLPFDTNLLLTLLDEHRLEPVAYAVLKNPIFKNSFPSDLPFMPALHQSYQRQ